MWQTDMHYQLRYLPASLSHAVYNKCEGSTSRPWITMQWIACFQTAVYLVCIQLTTHVVVLVQSIVGQTIRSTVSQASLWWLLLLLVAGTITTANNRAITIIIVSISAGFLLANVCTTWNKVNWVILLQVHWGVTMKVTQVTIINFKCQQKHMAILSYLLPHGRERIVAIIVCPLQPHILGTTISDICFCLQKMWWW